MQCSQDHATAEKISHETGLELGHVRRRMIRGRFVRKRRGALHDDTWCRTVSQVPNNKRKGGIYTRHVSNCLQKHHPNSFHWPCCQPCSLFFVGSCSSKSAERLHHREPTQKTRPQSRACPFHFRSPCIFHCLSSYLKAVCHCQWLSEAQ